MAWFFAVFFAVYASVNFYVIKRGWDSLEIAPLWVKLSFVIITIVVSSSYIFAKSILSKNTSFLYDFFLTTGAIWFALLVYVLLALLVFDIFRFTIGKIEIFNFLFTRNYSLHKLVAFLFVVAFCIVLVLAGLENANNLAHKKINIKLPHSNAPKKEYKIMFFSDLHLSPINDVRLLNSIIELNRKIQPDLILMGGDIVDDIPERLYNDKLDEKFSLLSAKLGKYACVGNHEFITGLEPSVKFLKDNNVNVLIDEVAVIDSFLQIVGRQDFSANRFSNLQRQELSELLKKTDPMKPVIVLDHQPFNLKETSNFKIDLHLSGHTHHGQLFPGSLITRIIYDISWGFEKIKNTFFYVSSGVGTWGPPIRIGSRSEVVEFVLQFD